MNLRLIAYVAMVVAPLFLCCPLWAEEEEGPPPAAAGDKVDDPAGRFFDIKVPDGFQSETMEEPGIMIWRKGRGEILLVVGELIAESAKDLYDRLVEAVRKDERLEKVDPVEVKGGLAFLCKEKRQEGPRRLHMWRLVVITDKKVVSIDFTAPNQDFGGFEKDFEAALKSFALKSSS
ncbi:MAG: hypothetical protein V2B18_02410 [Pseudomonadota bacterium]